MFPLTNAMESQRALTQLPGFSHQLRGRSRNAQDVADADLSLLLYHSVL